MEFMVKNRQNKKRNELIHYLRNGGAKNVIKNKSRMWKVQKPTKIEIKDRSVTFKKTDETVPF